MLVCLKFRKVEVSMAVQITAGQETGTVTANLYDSNDVVSKICQMLGSDRSTCGASMDIKFLDKIISFEDG